MTGRRARTGAGLATAFLLVGIAAVFAITLALDALSATSAGTPECTVADEGGEVRLAPEQIANAALIAGVGMNLGAGDRAVEVALATAMQESSLRNLDYGDRDSLGLFQQRPSQGWGTPAQVQDRVFATRAFYDGLLAVPGWAEMSLTEAAQAVQISAFPRAYAKHEPLARALRAAFTGARPASLTCHLPASTGLAPERVLAELAAAHPGAGAGALGEGILIRGVGRGAAGAGPAGTGAAGAGAAAQDPAAQDPAAQDWALAHWAVATAADTGAHTVTLPGWEWTRTEGWRETSGDGSGESGGVRLR